MHASLPADTLVEVTSLENGRTIVVLVTANDPAAGKPITLSAAAARELGHADSDGSMVPVRVRKVAAGPGDMLALRSGRPAAARPDTPPILLNALRKHLGAPVLAAADGVWSMLRAHVPAVLWSAVAVLMVAVVLALNLVTSDAGGGAQVAHHCLGLRAQQRGLVLGGLERGRRAGAAADGPMAAERHLRRFWLGCVGCVRCGVLCCKQT